MKVNTCANFLGFLFKKLCSPLNARRYRLLPNIQKDAATSFSPTTAKGLIEFKKK
jgi:hypothetical protein